MKKPFSDPYPESKATSVTDINPTTWINPGEPDYRILKGEEKPYDYINPSHYKKGNKEVFEMMIDIWGVDAYIAHCEMCSFKYRLRMGEKPDQPIERDLEKARWYENKAKEMRFRKAIEPQTHPAT